MNLKKYEQLLFQYEDTEDEEIREKLKQNLIKKYGTNRKCFRCGNQLLKSDLKEYSYLCLECDENFYGFETVEL